MAGPMLYIIQPNIIDPPPGTNPAELAWFARFASGHLCHVGQRDAAYGGANGIAVENQKMAWSEYQRLYKEAHWYENV
jgi:hypothetical protein